MLLDNQTPLSSLSALTWIAYRLYQCADPLKLCVFASKLSHQRPQSSKVSIKLRSKGCPDIVFLLETWDNQGSNKFGLSHFLIGHSRVRLFPRHQILMSNNSHIFRILRWRFFAYFIDSVVQLSEDGVLFEYCFSCVPYVLCFGLSKLSLFRLSFVKCKEGHRYISTR